MKSLFALRLRDGSLQEFSKPCVMGVINMSPNSFFRPLKSIEAALSLSAQMQAEGAAFIDIGGEATNPAVNLKKNILSEQEELDHVIPVVEAIAKKIDILISVDTSKPAVMTAAINAGAHMINDQRGLQEEESLALVAKFKVPVCLMHFFHPQRTPGSNSHEDLLSQIKQELKANVQRCLKAGILEERIIIDIGFGGGNYGKNTAENFYLLSKLNEFCQWKFPILAGLSRKSMIGEAINQPQPEKRLAGSIAAAVLAGVQGASIIRTHDVKETKEALTILQNIQWCKIKETD